MKSTEATEPCKEAAEAAVRDLHSAEAEMEQAGRDIEKAKAEIGDAEAHLRKAETEIEEAEHEHRHGEVEIKVDGRLQRVRAGTYIVSVFKTMVDVAADRELDIVEHDTFKPLDDNGEITICEHEVFVSHVRTGGSS
jgi:multidrug resistance efflux pump